MAGWVNSFAVHKFKIILSVFVWSMASYSIFKVIRNRITLQSVAPQTIIKRDMILLISFKTYE